MEQGWIKLHRSIYNHWLWKEDTKLKWWIDLLLMANHTTKKILLGNQLIEIPRGSLHTSVTKLTARWQADKKTVKRFLDLLQKDSMISYTTTSKGTTINICNYNDFQDFRKAESPGDAPAMYPEDGQATSPPPTLAVAPKDGTVSSTTAASENPLGQDPALSTPTPLESPHSVDNTITTPVVNPEVTTRDTNNNVNNNKNFNNANNGEEREEWNKDPLCPEAPEGPCANTTTKLPPPSFPTPLHKKIHNTLGDIAYRTWFMDADIASTERVATLQVDSPFKRDVINTKFRVQLGRILGKIVEIKSSW